MPRGDQLTLCKFLEALLCAGDSPLPGFWPTRPLLSGSYPGEGNDFSLQYSGLENPIDRGGVTKPMHYNY